MAIFEKATQVGCHKLHFFPARQLTLLLPLRFGIMMGVLVELVRIRSFGL